MVKLALSSLLSLGAAVGVAGAGLAQQSEPVIATGSDNTTVSADGTIGLSRLDLPPSSYWSPQFRAVYVRNAALIVTHRSYAQPAADAPKADWDAYDAGCVKGQAETLRWQKEHYPVRVDDTQIGGVRVARVTPTEGVAAENRGRVLIELHGGSCGGFDGLTEAIPVAHFGKITVVSVAYRATPREPYPASLDDVLQVYTGLLKSHRASRIGLFGTSGGGMLVSQALSRMQRDRIAQPGAAGIFWAGLTGFPYPFGKFGDSELWEGGGIPHNDHSGYRGLIVQLSQYLKGVPTDDPVAYPLSSDAVLRKFPPTLFLTGTRALDQSAAVASHARLLKLGVDASLYVMEGGWHAASYGTYGSPEEADVNSYIGKWFAAHLAK